MMAGHTIDTEKAAKALVDAHFMSDRDAAERNGVDARTIRRYRQRATSDHALSARVLGMLKELRTRPEWDFLDEALRTLINGLVERMDDLPNTPEAYEAIRAGAETLGTLQQTRRVIDAKLEAMRQGQPTTPAPQPRGFGQTEARA